MQVSASLAVIIILYKEGPLTTLKSFGDGNLMPVIENVVFNGCMHVAAIILVELSRFIVTESLALLSYSDSIGHRVYAQRHLNRHLILLLLRISGI